MIARTHAQRFRSDAGRRRSRTLATSSPIEQRLRATMSTSDAGREVAAAAAPRRIQPSDALRPDVERVGDDRHGAHRRRDRDDDDHAERISRPAGADRRHGHRLAVAGAAGFGGSVSAAGTRTDRAAGHDLGLQSPGRMRVAVRLDRLGRVGLDRRPRWTVRRMTPPSSSPERDASAPTAPRRPASGFAPPSDDEVEPAVAGSIGLARADPARDELAGVGDQDQVALDVERVAVGLDAEARRSRAATTSRTAAPMYAPNLIRRFHSCSAAAMIRASRPIPQATAKIRSWPPASASPDRRAATSARARGR